MNRAFFKKRIDELSHKLRFIRHHKTAKQLKDLIEINQKLMEAFK